MREELRVLQDRLVRAEQLEPQADVAFRARRARKVQWAHAGREARLGHRVCQEQPGHRAHQVHPAPVWSASGS